MAEPQEFDLDAAWAEEARPPFRFKWAGATWDLPHLGDMDWRAVSLADEMDVTQIRELFRLALPEDRADEWEQTKQPTPAMTRLFTAWLQHSGMAPGETPASDGSSPSTGRPSKRTSRGTTTSASRGSSSARRQIATAPANSSL